MLLVDMYVGFPLAHGPDFREEIREAFDLFDTERTGKMDYHELKVSTACTWGGLASVSVARIENARPGLYPRSRLRREEGGSAEDDDGIRPEQHRLDLVQRFSRDQYEIFDSVHRGSGASLPRWRETFYSNVGNVSQ